MNTGLNARSGGLPKDKNSSNSTVEANNKAGLNILFLGDSYTIGTGIDPQKSWPLQIQKKLVSENFSLNTTKMIAGNGWSSRELINQFSYFSPKNIFDIATIQIGVNDQFRNRDKKSYKKDFRELVELVIKVVGDDPKNIIIISIPDYSETPSGKELNSATISAEIGDFNEVNKSVADEKGIKYVDITDISKRLSKDLDFIAPDGLHFSSKMYSIWVEIILPSFLKIL